MQQLYTDQTEPLTAHPLTWYAGKRLPSGAMCVTPIHDVLIRSGLTAVKMLDVPAGADLRNEGITIVDGMPVQTGTVVMPTPITKEEKIKWIKAEARRRILAVLPQWKKDNMQATASALIRNELRNGSLTPEEAMMEKSLEAAWGWVLQVRAFSDKLEAEITDKTTLADIESAPWPEAPAGLA